MLESQRYDQPQKVDKGKGVAHHYRNADSRSVGYESHESDHSELECDDGFSVIPPPFSPRSRYPPVHHRTISPSAASAHLKSPPMVTARMALSTGSRTASLATKKTTSSERTPRAGYKPGLSMVSAATSRGQTLSEHNAPVEDEYGDLYDSVSDEDLSQLKLAPASPSPTVDNGRRRAMRSQTTTAPNTPPIIIQPTIPTPLPPTLGTFDKVLE